MPRDIDQKFRATAAFIGAVTRKDLAAAFRRANPSTAFDVERANKWLQGRSRPGGFSIYEDWVKVIGLGRSPQWVADCTIEEFTDTLGESMGVDGREALARAAEKPRPRAAITADVPSGPTAGMEFLEGHYACFSHAQSPYFSGRLIRSALTVEISGAAEEAGTAHYTQAGASFGIARMKGPVRMYGQTPCLDMHAHSASLAPVFVTLFRPTMPASVLVGIMTSCAVVDPSNQPPYATQFIAVRTPPDVVAKLEESNRYLEQNESPAADLAALGLNVTAAPDLDAAVGDYLGAGHWAGSFRGSADAAMRLTAICDQIWIATQEATSNTAG